MRHLVLALGASAVLALCVAEACSNTEVVGGGAATTTTTSQGGSGNHGNTGGSGNHGNTGGGGSGGACSGGGPCEQACCKITDECGFPISCDAIPQLDCVNGQPAADCFGGCILAVDCATIMTLAPGGTPDPGLLSCMQDCNGAGGGNPCSDCVTSDCGSETTTCAQTPACQPYVQCIMGCSSQQCLTDCLTNNPSAEASALAACICGSCNASCPCGAGGAGGAAGGAGGA